MGRGFDALLLDLRIRDELLAYLRKHLKPGLAIRLSNMLERDAFTPRLYPSIEYQNFASAAELLQNQLGYEYDVTEPAFAYGRVWAIVRRKTEEELWRG